MASNIDIDISAVVPNPADNVKPNVKLDGYTDAQLVMLDSMLREEHRNRALAKQKANAEAEKNRVANCKSFPKFAKNFKDLKARAKAFTQKVSVVIPIEFTLSVDPNNIFDYNFSAENSLAYAAKLGASYKGSGRDVLKAHLDNLCAEVLKIVPKEVAKEFESIRKEAAKFKSDILEHDLRLSDFG